MRIFTSLILLISISISSFSQNTWKVREAAGAGTDFTGIAEAIEDAQVLAGDTLDILGTFTESAIVLSKALVFKGHGEDQTIIQAADSKFDATDRVFYHNQDAGGATSGKMIFMDLTVQNGNATVSQTGAGWGGAMYFLGQIKLEFENVTIKDSQSNGNGGAIYTWVSSIKMNNTEIVNNEAVVGRCGGLYLWLQQGYDININITNSVFDGNKALVDHAGALAIMKADGMTNKTTVNFENTTFHNNQSFSGPVFWNEKFNSTGGHTISLINCTVVDNKNTENAGWFGVTQFWAPYTDITFIAKNNFFKGNININKQPETEDYWDFWVPFWGENELDSLAFIANVGYFFANNESLPSQYTYDENDASLDEAELSIAAIADNGGNVRTIALESPNIGIDKLNASHGVPAHDARGFVRAGENYDVGAYETDGYPVSINDRKFEINQLRIAPNPVNDHFYIENSRAGKLKIYNMTGQVVMSIQSINENQAVNVSDLPKGMYILHFDSDEFKAQSKLIKK